jgi:hypothetical protein
MFNIFKSKSKHEHDWELVAVNDQFHTTYTDTNETKYWEMRFYKCACGERKFSDNRPHKHVTHQGMEKSKDNWIDAGVVPKNSYDPRQSQNYIKIDDIEREKLDPVLEYQRTLNELVKSLGVVINRDFDLESRYPKLKQAADEYHRQLDKYRNFESLKEHER